MRIAKQFEQNQTRWGRCLGYRLLVAGAVILIANGYCWAQAFTDVSDSVGLAHAPASPSSHLEVPGHLTVHWIDFDNDGWVDIVLPSGDLSQINIYRNNGAADPCNVTFSYFGDIAGLGAWGDFDNDGFLDMFGNGKVLFHNNDGISVTDVTATVGIDAGVLNSTTPYTRSVVWCDLNNDGFLDLYIGGRGLDGSNGNPDLILMNYDDSGNAGNPTGRRFEKVWQQSTVNPARGVTVCDFDEDNDMDVYVSSYSLTHNNILWRNDGTGIFAGGDDVASTYGVTASMGWSIGSAFVDIDNDGHFDLFAGNFAHSGNPQSQFLRNMGSAGSYHFENKGTAGVYWQESYASPTFGDYDNDGDLDLLFTCVYVGNRPKLFRNDSVGSTWNFTDVTASEGIPDLWPAYGAAWADYNNDGWLDLYCSGRIFKNNNGANHWLKVKLSGGGPAGINRSAIGTQVRIAWQGKTLTRQVGSETGESNQNDMTLHFGLGSSAGPVDLEITWPNGTVQNVTDVAVDQILEVGLLLEGDLNQDYKVDHEDLAVIGQQWLGCSDPIDPECTY